MDDGAMDTMAAAGSARRIGSLRELRALIREDRRTNFGKGRPGFQALAVYRVGVYAEGIESWWRRAPFALIHWLGNGFVRNFYGIELYTSSRIGRRVLIGHQHGIIIHPDAVIGDDCILRQGVTLGQTGYEPGPAPRIGNRVELGVNVVLMGGISVGDDVRIGPNAVVMRNVPAGAIVTAQPARIMAPPPRRQPAAADPAVAAPEA